ncbi:MAG: OmpA family protein [Myxococcota bacterium]
MAPAGSDVPVAAAEELAAAQIPATRDVPVEFRYDTYEPTVKTTFPAFVDLVRAYRGKVRLTGHTDSRGPAAANYEMGLGRAWAVQRLLWIAGVEIEKVPIASKGETEPIGDNTTPAGRAMNRRVEAEFLAPAGGDQPTP